MNVELTRTAVKRLQKLPEKEAKKVLRKITLLEQSPLSGKKLEGKLSDRYSLRAWPYRIIYVIENDRVIVDVIQHRQSVYNK